MASREATSRDNVAECRHLAARSSDPATLIPQLARDSTASLRWQP